MAYWLSIPPLALLPLGLSLLLLGLIGRWRWPGIMAVELPWLIPLGLVRQGGVSRTDSILTATD